MEVVNDENEVVKKKKYVYPKEYIAEKNKKYYEKNKEKLLLRTNMKTPTR